MNVEKSVRRARQNYINALRRLERERQLVITDIEILRAEIVSDNEFGVESVFGGLMEHSTHRERYLWKVRKDYEERHLRGGYDF